MNISVRKAGPSDARRIAEIYNEGIKERSATFETELRTEKAMRKWLRDHDGHHPVLVATVESDSEIGNGTVVGWTSVTAYRPRACYSGVGEFSVYVKSGYSGKGIGKKLILSLVDEATKLGYWKLLSRIFTFNTASRGLCKKCGFREVGIYRKHGKLDGKWLDTVIVERLIPENID